VCYRIGDQVFTDLPNLLAFYKLHYLDTVPLIRPAKKKIERVMAKYDFDGQVSSIFFYVEGEKFGFLSDRISIIHNKLTITSRNLKFTGVAELIGVFFCF
jgi:hypothetical protein